MARITGDRTHGEHSGHGGRGRRVRVSGDVSQAHVTRTKLDDFGQGDEGPEPNEPPRGRSGRGDGIPREAWARAWARAAPHAGIGHSAAVRHRRGRATARRYLSSSTASHHSWQADVEFGHPTSTLGSLFNAVT